MADDVRKLVKIRGGHRANLKKTLALTEELVNGAKETQEESQASHLEVKLMQQRLILEEKLQILKQFDDKIVLLIEEVNIGEEIANSDEIRQAIQGVIVHVDFCLERLKKNWSKDTSSSSMSAGSVPLAPISPPTNNTTVRLPKLELKHFNGNLMEWTSFWDSYSSSIHENSNLSEIDKFNYLHSLLEKSAAEAVSGLKITSANYQEAVDILKNRFGNLQQIVNAHMNALLNLTKVGNVEDLKGLRQLHGKVDGHMRGMKSLEVDSKSYGSLLIPVLLEKLPKELRLEATRKLKGNWELDELIQIFKEELEARERASVLQSSPKDSTQKQIFKPKFQSAAFLFAGGLTPTCTYCQRPHTSNSCSTVTDINERKEILKRSGRCFICLRKNHVARDCKSKTKCFKCDKRHHISICPSSFNEKPAPPEQEVSQPPTSAGSQFVNNQTVPPRITQQGNQSLHQPENTHVNMFVDRKSSILLQTAPATICNPNDPSKSYQARLIFDTGSQRSYITTRLKERLHLPML